MEPIAERFARALEVFSRARAAKERRFRREIEPITEPVKLGVAVVEGGAVEAGTSEVMMEEVEVKLGRPKSTAELEEGTVTRTEEEEGAD